MGNQASHAHHAGGHVATNEPLESFSREKERDDHLKNLGFKRSKSLRKSISKKLRRKKKEPGNEDVVDGPSSKSRKGSEASVETRVEVERSKDKPDRPIVGQPEPLPTHVQEISSLEGARPRTMDLIRKSFRVSKKKKKESSLNLDPTVTSDPVVKGSTTDSSKLWQTDEVNVRSGTCHFQVKYLGCVEVFNSRGMDVCEEAVKVLKNSKRKSVRAVLYVSGDGLRVVDDETRGLIVDQTIEKVSFCAPDRNYERGFSYICRDGTTRRWMCHGFMAIRDSGERLSHAVGCAFAICLERKQKRDSECNVSVSFDSKNASFTRFGSFRQATLSERLQDPQVLKPAQPPPAKEKEENPFAIARPHATDIMLQRQTSFRGFANLQATGNSPFKRQLSLRLNELPSTLERQRSSGLQISNQDSLGKDFNLDLKPTSMIPLDEVTEENEETCEINKMCQEVSTGLARLSSDIVQPESKQFLNGDLKLRESLSRSPRASMTTSPLPTVPENNLLQTTTVANQVSPIPPATSISGFATNSSSTGSNLDTFPTSAKPLEYDNPWDWVPDQPLRSAFNTSKTSTQSNCDSSSSGISTGSAVSITAGQHRDQNQFSNKNSFEQNPFLSKLSPFEHPTTLPNGENSLNESATLPKVEKTQNIFSSSNSEFASDIFSNQTRDMLNGNALLPTVEKSGFDDFFWSTSLTEASVHETSAGILEDPFDAEWAALAMRNTSSKNPFLGDKNETGLKKAFELHM